jgi:hypothetical protein
MIMATITDTSTPSTPQRRIDVWTLIATPPVMHKELGDWRYKSRRALGLTPNGRQQVVYASLEEIEPGEIQYPVKWTTDCSEGWDVTGQLLYWRDLPLIDVLPGVTLDPDYL